MRLPPPLLRTLLLLSLTCFAADPVAAVPYTLADTDQRELPRSANGRSYLLYIGLPPSYATQPTRRFPTVYALDGYWDFSLLTTVTGLLRVDAAAPEVIVVGIGYAGTNPDVNALRAIDLTPGVDPWFDSTGTRCGRAEEFLNVIANEIIPFVEREYRADAGYRVLTGTSFAGLFSAYAAVERPGMFQAHVACSPALWWRSRYLQTRESELAASRTSFPVRLYLSYASEEGSSIIESTRALFRQLNTRTYAGFSLAVRETEGERHSTTKPEAYMRGLRFAFAPLAPQPATVAVTERSTLVNISSRGFIGTDDHVMIAGFVITGLVPKRVLVRAGGPALAGLNVSGVLADPQVRVHSGQTVVAENDNWSDTDEMDLAVRQSGAYPLAHGSRDAALIVTLPPGIYTAIGSGVGNTTGNALVEVYELP